jgi:hypothetical protein
VGRSFAALTPALTDFVAAQRVFFVASAPLSGDGHVNLSPKGADTFRVLDDRRVAYLDLTGSGAETIAHLRENGRITLLFTAFEGAPQLVRLFGRGEAVLAGDPRFEELVARFPALPGTRAVIVVDLDRVGTSCGFGVPVYDYVAERTRLHEWAASKGPEGVAAYQASRNATSIDGLPALADTADAGTAS